MECSIGRTRLFRRLDNELSSTESAELDEHLKDCSSCARDLRLLMLPGRIGKAIPALVPSPYFYQRLRARLDGESQSITIWQIILELSRQLVPALAAITLALLAVFAYVELKGPEADVYQAYDSIFISGDRPQRMIIADEGEITNESVFRAIAEQETARQPSPGAQGAKR